MTDLVEAERYNSRIEADIARLYLESEGLDSVLFDAEINSSYGGLFMPVRLMVLDEDVDRARRLLAEKR